jgi:hypothetical protein
MPIFIADRSSSSVALSLPRFLTVFLWWGIGATHPRRVNVRDGMNDAPIFPQDIQIQTTVPDCARVGKCDRVGDASECCLRVRVR